MVHIPRFSAIEMPDVFIPGEVHQRNDIYITLGEGFFTTEKRFNSTEIVIGLKSEKGKLIEGCIEASNTYRTFYHSTVYHHTNNPKWNETVKISLPASEDPDSLHIYFDFRSWSSKERVHDKRIMGFWKLSKNDVFLPNGKHDVTIVKLPKIVKDPVFYLSDESAFSSPIKTGLFLSD